MLSLATAVALAGGVILAPVAGATAPAKSKPTMRTVASGLNNPRHLSFSQPGTLYVAEAGAGGTGACLPNPEGGDEVCLGMSGSITAIARNGKQSRVVTGLPSLAGPDGSSAAGPMDVSVSGQRTISIAMGLGSNPAGRASLGPDAAWLGTILSGKLAPNPRLSVFADVVGYEGAHDPDGLGVDSNTSSILRVGSRFLTTDAGGNDLVSFGKHGRASTVAVFPDTMVPVPPFIPAPPGAMMPMQAVPTGVAIGPDGAYYVSQLTGFPFPQGGASIWRVVPGKAPTKFATGFTNVTDLAWAGNKLYVVQMADAGLASGGAPMGSLVEVSNHGATHRTVAAGLFAPYGVAVRGGAAYVTTCSVCAGGGAVQEIPLG